MKIRLEKDELAEAVTWTARSLPRVPSSPVLAGLRLRSIGDTVELAAYDTEISASSVVSAANDEPGEVVISGRLLAEIAKALPNQPVELGLEGSRVTLRCGRSTFGLPTLPVEDYPLLPELPPQAGTVVASEFADAVMQVVIASSRDETLPPLTGIFMEFSGDTITLAATDRYRLAMREIAWQPADPNISTAALVRARQLAELARTVGSARELRIALGEDDDGRIGFSVDGRQLVTRLLRGSFPEYRKLLPTEAATVVHVDNAALIEAVKRVKLVTADRTSPIRLQFSDDEVLLRAGAGDEAQASESLECSIEGDPIEIAFNPDYLLEGLGALGSEQVACSFTLPSKPAVLTSPGVDYRYLLMPVRLGS